MLIQNVQTSLRRPDGVLFMTLHTVSLLLRTKSASVHFTDKLPCIIEIKWLYRSVNHDSCMKYIIYIVHLSIDLCSCFCKLRQPDILLNETVLLWFCFCSWSCDRVFKIHFKMSQNYTLIQSKTQIFNKTKSSGKTNVVLCTLLPYCQTRV